MHKIIRLTRQTTLIFSTNRRPQFFYRLRLLHSTITDVGPVRILHMHRMPPNPQRARERASFDSLMLADTSTD